MPARITLVLGGARSGKSRHAEALVVSFAGNPIYLATATAGDDEMADRIARHRRDRGEGWQTIEEPLELARIIRDRCDPSHAEFGRPILIDCLTLWLMNLMGAERSVEAATADLVAALDESPGPVVLVANEVGLGLVPESAFSRSFRDHAGRINQSVAAHASRVVFVAAGLPLVLKDPPE